VSSRSDNIYVLTIIDGFSKFVYVKAIPNKKSETVASAMFEFFTIFGYPNRVHSDLGKEFINEILSCILKLFGITKSNTTPDRTSTPFKEKDEVMLYRPQALSGDSRKLSVHWYGPYTVHKVGRNNKVYYLNDPLGDPLKYPVSHALLKPYIKRPGELPPFSPFPQNIESVPEYNKDKEDSSSPNALLQWNGPADAYAPPVVPPANTDDEERAVLEQIR
jgi:hypothetical protein